jgi:hypothetical protein
MRPPAALLTAWMWLQRTPAATTMTSTAPQHGSTLTSLTHHQVSAHRHAELTEVAVPPATGADMPFPQLAASQIGNQYNLTAYRGASDRLHADVPTRASPKCCIHSMNMRGGASSQRKRKALRPLVCGNSVLQPGDIVCIQETMLHGADVDKPMDSDRAQQYADDIAPQCRSFWTGHCGVVVSPSLDDFSVAACALLGGRLILLTLSRDDAVLLLHDPVWMWLPAWA